MNRMTTTTVRKPTQRAFDDCRTTWAARSGLSSTLRVAGGDENRSTGAGSAGGRGTGSRCSGSPSGVSVIGPLGGQDGTNRSSDAPRRRARRDEARLAEGDRERPERDLAGIDGQGAGRVDRDREAVHAPRRGPELGAIGLGPEPVVARAVARALEPEVLEAWVRLAAEVRAALVERADVEGLAVPGRVLARDEPLLSGVVQDDEGPCLRVVRREAFLDRQGRVLELDRVQVADRDR